MHLLPQRMIKKNAKKVRDKKCIKHSAHSVFQKCLYIPFQLVHQVNKYMRISYPKQKILNQIIGYALLKEDD